jgi:multidrug transporter EmrE-like cation transporter
VRGARTQQAGRFQRHLATMYFALLLAVVSSVAFSVGFYFMKRQAERLPSLGGGWRPTAWWAFLHDPLWLLGVALQTGGFGLYLAALRAAPLSVVHTALSGGVALFVLLAVVGLGERLRASEWLGVGCVLAGLIVLGFSLADSPAPTAVGRGTVTFSLVLIGLSVAALAADPAPGRAVGLSIACGLTLGLASVFAKSLAGADSLAAALRSRDLLLTLATNLVGFALMQAALQVGRGVVVVPIFSTLSNVVPVVGGIVLYGEWMPRAATAAILRPLAFLLAIGGAALLAGVAEQPTRHLEQARSQ